MPRDSPFDSGSGGDGAVYCVGGGARTLLRAAVAVEDGLLSTGAAGAAAGDVGDSEVVVEVVRFDTDRLAVAAYPELSEFMVSRRPSDGATDALDDSRSTGGGAAPACS